MIKKEQIIAAGSEKLADIILNLYQGYPSIQKQLDIILAGLEEGGLQEMVSMIQKEIQSLKRSNRYFDYYEAEDLEEELDQLRLRIAQDVLAQSTQEALKLMHSLIKEYEAVSKLIRMYIDELNGRDYTTL